MIYQMYKSAKFGLVSYCHYISLIYIYIYIYVPEDEVAMVLKKF